VDGEFACFVRAVDGAVATLSQLGGVAPALAERLGQGATGYLMRTDSGARLALRGVATPAPDGGDGFAFVVLDGLAPQERRGAPRTPVVASAQITGVSGDPSHAGTETVTVDISQSGALLERRTGLDVGVRIALALVFEDFPAPVQCEAEVVRDTLTHVGVVFRTIDERNRARLAVILSQYRRRLGLT
jgi:PilZ domain